MEGVPGAGTPSIAHTAPFAPKPGWTAGAPLPTGQA